MIPKTIVFPRVRVSAWQGNLPVAVPTYPSTELSNALTSTYASDTCIVQYGPPRGEIASPRLGVGAAAYYQQHPARAPMLESILVDIDHEDHTPPPDHWHLDIIAKIPESIGFGWYRTPNGMRLVFLPLAPVPITHANNYLRWFHEDILQGSWAIESDPACRTWYRFFKAPRALGRDLPADFTDLKPLPVHPPSLDADDARSFGMIAEYDDIPDVKTPPIKLLRAYIGDEKIVQKLRYGQPLAAPGERHSVLLATAVKIAYGMNSKDPADIYACVHSSAQAQGTTQDEAWKICEWAACVIAGAQLEAREAHRDAYQEFAAATGGDQRRLIYMIGSTVYIWNEEHGRHVGPFVAHSSKKLVSLIRDHCPTLLDPRTKGEELEERYITVPQKIAYNYIIDQCTYDADTWTLWLPAAQVDRSIRPRFHADVDEWVGMLGGDRLRDWLASFARLDKPACALYIHAGAGAGKGLLAQGIARVFSPDSAFTAYGVLFAEFQASLLLSPLVVADEKVPTSTFNQNESAVFREILTNPSRRVNQKNIARVTLYGHVRVLITANNDNALQIREALTPEDVEAVQERLGYLRVTGDAPARFLDERDDLKTWADQKIPEYILHLMHTRATQVVSSGRYVVPGWPSALTELMSTSHGAVNEVIDIIATAIRDDVPQDAIRWFGGEIYVYAPDLAKSWLMIQGQDIDRPPSNKARLEALRTLSGGEKRQLRRTEKKGRRMRMYWVIDPEIIARHAERQNLALASEIIDACARVGDKHTLIAPVDEGIA